jgi:ribonuclease HI
VLLPWQVLFLNSENFLTTHKPSYTSQGEEAWYEQTGALIPVPNSRLQCQIDGSYSSPYEGGAAYILYHGQILIEYEVVHFQAQSPFHSELRALQLAIEAIRQRGCTEVTILTDCLLLTKLMASSYPPLDMDWRMYKQGTMAYWHGIFSELKNMLAVNL